MAIVPPVEAVQNSVGFAALTVLLALVLGTISAYLLARRNVHIKRGKAG